MTHPGIGAPRYDVDETPSTQDDAKRLVDEGAPHGAVVVARRQTAGRGRLGRPWTTFSDDALAFSLILRPTSVTPTQAPRATLLVGVAVVEALLDLGVEAGVKWPNDLVVKHDVHGVLGKLRKVAGVLVEGVWHGAGLRAFVVGVGVNVRRPSTGWPEELAPIAGALSEAGFAGTNDEVLAAILRRVEARLPALTDDAAFADVLDAHRRRSSTLGRDVEVRDGDQVRAGRALDLDDDGALLLVDRCGHTVTVRAGDVVPV